MCLFPAGTATEATACGTATSPRVTAGTVLSSMPTFAPSAASAQGLDLLAAAAAASSLSNHSTARVSTLPSGSSFAPFNPAASLPAKLVKRILDLEFVEMSDITTDVELPQTPGRPTTSGRLPVTDISIWVEKFSVLAAILVTRFPEKAAELFAYQASIVRAERNYEGNRWVVYDRQYRREALARKDLNWSMPDSRLYNEAFTGRAKAIARCTYCLQEDHITQACPRNPNRPVPGWFPELPWGSDAAHPTPRPPAQQTAVCRRWNENRCKFTVCKYRHDCLHCGGAHMALDCSQKRPYQRSWSPLRGNTRNAAPPTGPRGPRF